MELALKNELPFLGYDFTKKYIILYAIQILPVNNASLIRKKKLALWSMWEKYHLYNIIYSLSRDQGSRCMLIV